MKRKASLIIIYSLCYGILFELRNTFWEEHFFLPVYHADRIVSFGQMIVAMCFMLFLRNDNIDYINSMLVQLIALCYFSFFFLYKFLHHTSLFYTNYLLSIKGFLFLELPHIIATVTAVYFIHKASTWSNNLKRKHWFFLSFVLITLTIAIHIKSYMYYSEHQMLQVYILLLGIFFIGLLLIMIWYTQIWIKNFVRLSVITLAYLCLLIILALLAKSIAFHTEEMLINLYEHYSWLYVHQGMFLGIYVLIRHPNILRKLKAQDPFFIF